jgi:hypothetical protein
MDESSRLWSDGVCEDYTMADEGVNRPAWILPAAGARA